MPGVFVIGEKTGDYNTCGGAYATILITIVPDMLSIVGLIFSAVVLITIFSSLGIYQWRTIG